jgi:hypothetical protein
MSPASTTTKAPSLVTTRSIWRPTVSNRASRRSSSSRKSCLVATLSWIASKISVAIRSAFWRSILASARALVRESRSVRSASAQRSAFGSAAEGRCGTGLIGVHTLSVPRWSTRQRTGRATGIFSRSAATIHPCGRRSRTPDPRRVCPAAHETRIFRCPLSSASALAAFARQQRTGTNSEQTPRIFRVSAGIPWVCRVAFRSIAVPPRLGYS